MGIYGALATAVSGLQAQSFALENISGNIANSQTTGFKRTDTSFADLINSGDLNVRRQVSGSVQSFSRSTNDLQGTLLASSSPTSLAVKGSGYLLVQQQTGESNGQPTFAGGELYTRRGDFEFDKNGYMVNGAGYFLKGQKLDPATGSPIGASSEPIQILSDSYPAVATTTIDYRANLPTTPRTTNYEAGNASSWLLDPAMGATVTAAQSSAFLSSTVAGDAVTLYDQGGNSVDAQLRWGKVANANAAATPAVQDTWALFYQSNSAATGTDAEWTRVDADTGTAGAQDYTFDATGKLTSPASGSTTLTGLTINGRVLGDIQLVHATGLTQYANADGAVSTKQLTQDGATSGELVTVEVADGGLVNATYSNGKSRPLYRIPLVTFYAENRLAQIDGGAYAQTVGSGGPLASTEGEIIGQAIEQSNVDIADEFTKMIVTQQAYSANTRVISTSDDMLQETLNMIR